MNRSCAQPHLTSNRSPFWSTFGLIFALLFSVVTFISASSQARGTLDAYTEEAPAVTAVTAAVTTEPSRTQILERIEAAQPAHESEARSILADLDLNATANLDLSIFKGLGAGLGYTYEVHPAYQDDMYTRIDRWRPRLAVELPRVFTRIESNAEIVFIRQFPSQWDAVKAIPIFDPKRIPLTTENALRLQPGEVVMLPVELNLMFGKHLSATMSPVSLYGQGYYVMKGRFQIQVLRMKENRVRLRLVGIRSQGPEFEGGARLSLDVFNISVLSSATEGLLGKKVASIGFSRGARAVVMADYVFDLGDANARNAYDRLLAADQKLSKVKLVNPLGSEAALERAMISDLTEVDRIAAEDAAKPVEAKRVFAVFKGHSEGSVETEKRQLNLFRLFSLGRTTSVSKDNHIVFMDSDNQEIDFFAPTSTRTVNRKFLFGLGSENFTRKASVIVPADTEGKPKGLGEYVVSVEIKDKRMGQGETAKALRYFRRSIARPIVASMGLDLLLTDTKYKHARVYVQAIFNQDAMTLFSTIDPATLRGALDRYLSGVRDQLPGKDAHDHADWIHDRRKDIDQTLTQLTKAFSIATPVKDRIRIFIDLQKNKFFREAGTGFLMSLLPEADLSRLVGVTMRVDAVGFQNPIEKSFGASDFDSVVKVTEYIQHMLDEGTFDLRLETFGTDLSTAGQVVSFKELRRLSGDSNRP